MMGPDALNDLGQVQDEGSGQAFLEDDFAA